MKGFSEMNPRVSFVVLLLCAGVVMFSLNPVLLGLSLLGALSLRVARDGAFRPATAAFYVLLLLAVPMINVLFTHRGSTVLFLLNDNRITLEALLYGVFSGFMLVCVLMWFASLTKIMTTDRMLYIFGAASPKLALLLAMTLRFIPLFGRQAAAIDRTQRALGLYAGGGLVDSVRRKTRVFSILTTWALENGITTADSMSARGYGTGGRTSFNIYRFETADWIMLGAAAALAAACAAGLISGAVDYSFYPAAAKPPVTPMALAIYLCYGVLAVLPAVLETAAAVWWRRAAKRA